MICCIEQWMSHVKGYIFWIAIQLAIQIQITFAPNKWCFNTNSQFIKLYISQVDLNSQPIIGFYQKNLVVTKRLSSSHPEISEITWLSMSVKNFNFNDFWWMIRIYEVHIFALPKWMNVVFILISVLIDEHIPKNQFLNVSSDQETNMYNL